MHAVSKFSEFVPLEIPDNVLEQIVAYADWITPEQAVSTEREIASKQLNTMDGKLTKMNAEVGAMKEAVATERECASKQLNTMCRNLTRMKAEVEAMK